MYIEKRIFVFSYALSTRQSGIYGKKTIHALRPYGIV